MIRGASSTSGRFGGEGSSSRESTPPVGQHHVGLAAELEDALEKQDVPPARARGEAEAPVELLDARADRPPHETFERAGEPRRSVPRRIDHVTGEDDDPGEPEA